MTDDTLEFPVVLDRGEDVAPECEDGFATSPRIDRIMVVGDDRTFVGTLVVPDFDLLRSWAASEGLALPEDRASLCRDEWVREEIDARNEALSALGRIEVSRLVPTEWTAENDPLTPSLEKKHHEICREFAAAIEDTYDE